MRDLDVAQLWKERRERLLRGTEIRAAGRK
jgi:hypothetical protein